MTRSKNALSIDLEHWYSNEFLLKYLPDKPESQVVEATEDILKLLRKYDIKATFFVLGMVAEKHPDFVKQIYEEGHEIGCHAYTHTPLYKLGKDEFEKELEQSTELLYSITKERPLGFRAPSFSVNQSTNWVYELLYKYGYKYDSSIFPIQTMLYGCPGAPLVPYRPNINNIIENDPDGKIIEFPLTVYDSIRNIPVAGGFYFRVIPGWVLRQTFNQITKDRPVIMYIHPWETYSKTTRLKVPPHIGFEAYFGINNSLRKMESLVKKFQFTTVRDILEI
jgi:peptidoglycan-N-acetylglucosamine deacetylase